MMIRFVKKCVIVVMVLTIAAAVGFSKDKKGKKDLPKKEAIRVKNTIDGKEQPSYLYVPPGAEGRKGKPVPLLVQLHSWGSRMYLPDATLRECVKRRWAVIGPHYRGGNTKPSACASEVAMQDVLDAVAHVCKRFNIDKNRIYVMGASGGGHMTMAMVARAPQLWAGASEWVGISDLFKWHAYCKAKNNGYDKKMEACCGGAPGTSKEVDEQYRKRSPIFHLSKAKGVPFDFNHGHLDGAIPPSESINAFNVLAKANGRAKNQVPEKLIEHIDKKRKIPPELAKEKVSEKGRKHKILFRREAGPVRITIFKGGHSGDFPTGIEWLSKQKKE